MRSLKHWIYTSNLIPFYVGTATFGFESLNNGFEIDEWFVGLGNRCRIWLVRVSVLQLRVLIGKSSLPFWFHYSCIGLIFPLHFLFILFFLSFTNTFSYHFLYTFITISFPLSISYFSSGSMHRVVSPYFSSLSFMYKWLIEFYEFVLFGYLLISLFTSLFHLFYFKIISYAESSSFLHCWCEWLGQWRRHRL